MYTMQFAVVNVDDGVSRVKVRSTYNIRTYIGPYKYNPCTLNLANGIATICNVARYA